MLLRALDEKIVDESRLNHWQKYQFRNAKYSKLSVIKEMIKTRLLLVNISVNNFCSPLLIAASLRFKRIGTLRGYLLYTSTNNCHLAQKIVKIRNRLQGII